MDKKLKQLENDINKVQKKKEKLELQNYKLTNEVENSEQKIENLVK